MSRINSGLQAVQTVMNTVIVKRWPYAENDVY